MLVYTPLRSIDEIHSLDTALEVPNPTKSCMLYRELLHEGEAEYYEIGLFTGERLRISLNTKEFEGDSFSPIDCNGREFREIKVLQVMYGFSQTVFLPALEVDEQC